MGEVTLAEVLAAKEHRVLRQQALLREYGFSLVSFTMNIAGPIKTDSYSRAAFLLGREKLLSAMGSMGYTVAVMEDNSSVAGFELLCAVDAPPEELKKICILLENAAPVGRLFDMDVIARDGEKLSRAEERCCLVCGRPGRECASRRLHPVAELRDVTNRIIREHFLNADGEELASLAVQSLLDEVCVTPKPGLVDRAGNGSHQDMDIFSFNSSASVLWPYFRECFLKGAASAELPAEEVLPLLKAPGLEAERVMYRATGGVNTHKGAIYTLGILCAAAGRLWSVETRPEAFLWLQACGGIASSNAAPGVREEVAEGLPSVRTVALPALQEAEAAGLNFNDACLYVLLHLISEVRDTNMVCRGGEEKALAARRKVKSWLDGLRLSPEMFSASAKGLSELSQFFVSENLSPGGCADLLAAALLVSRWAGNRERNSCICKSSLFSEHVII